MSNPFSVKVSGSKPAITGTNTGSGTGVKGQGNGQSGLSPSVGCGVWGDSQTSHGVYATSQTTSAILAQSQNGHGVHAVSQAASGVEASSQSGHGVHAVNGSGAGTTPSTECGVWGESDNGIGVYGASKNGFAGYFQGIVTVTGDVVLTCADCGEWFDVSASATAEAGTVMVIGDDGALRPSKRAYDKRVAGVVSGAGAFRPGIVLDKRADDEQRATIALVGKVYCKVDADAGPIGVGDLLTTSDTPGYAMSVTDPVRAFGAVIGKSLSALRSGRGLLPILIALQ
jgi:hypothetical protein